MKLTTLIAAATIAAASCTPAHAGGSFFTAGRLYADCTGDGVSQLTCAAYIVGALDMGNNVMFCIPDSLQPKVVREAFIVAMAKNPQLHSKPADVVLAAMLQPNYPCRKSTEDPAATEPRRNPRGANWS